MSRCFPTWDSTPDGRVAIHAFPARPADARPGGNGWGTDPIGANRRGSEGVA